MERVKDNTNFKPTVFWAWNGDMCDEEIVRSIAAFDKAGIGGLHLHARAGLTIEYLGEEWIRAYRTTIRECKAHNMEIWIYDEQGWPSGFAGGKVNSFGEDYLLKYLSKSETLDGIPKERLLASYKKDGDKYVRVTSDDNADLYVYFDIQEHYVDLLNPDVCSKFINCTHEVYKREFSDEFGKTIKGVFTDEPQIHVSARAWSVAIPNAYFTRYGEDVLDGLYLLFESDNEKYQEFRYKYYAVIRDLFLNNYTKKIYEWCDENGLVSTGHVAGEEGLCVQVASNTGAMPHYEYLHRPGVDHLGRKLNSVLLLKQIQSVAHQFSKKRVLCEVFACTGNGVSFKDLAWIWNYHTVFGVNSPCMSISMYRLGGVRKRDYPVFLSEQQPWWSEFSQYNKFMTNSCEFAAEGEDYADVMLLSAINGALCEPIFSTKQKVVSAAYRRLVESLIFMQVPYEIGDETLLNKYGKVEKGKIKLGKSSYSRVIIPETSNITTHTLNLICDFVKSGGKAVCMTKYPERVDGKRCDLAERKLAECGIEIIQQRKGIIEKYFRREQYVRSVYTTDSSGKLSDGLYLTFKVTEKGKNIVLMNPSTDAEREVWLHVNKRGSFKSVDILDMSEREIRSEVFGSVTAISIKLAPKQCARFRFYDNEICNAEGEEIIQTKVLPVAIKNLTDNALTLDKAKYRFAGSEYSSEMPLVKANDLIYREVEEYDTPVPLSLEYTFDCDCIPEKLCLAAETMSAKTLNVNDNFIDVNTKLRYLDMDFKLYDITKYICKGKNKVVIDYEIKPLRLGFDLNSVHDSVRNKFSYPVDIESIYLTGDFSVSSKSETVHETGFIRTAGDFVITHKNQTFKNGDITEQGYWFYPGNAEYESEFEWHGERAVLNLDYCGTACVIYVNGKKVGVDFLAGEDKDITAYLKEGKNKLKLTVTGSIRNLLGPHHHCKGEPEYTGVHSFTGEFGNGAVEDSCAEDMPDKVWNDSYAFVKLGLNKVRLIYKAR